MRRTLLYVNCPSHCIKATRPGKAGAGGVLVRGGDNGSPASDHAVRRPIASPGNDGGTVPGCDCRRGVD